MRITDSLREPVCQAGLYSQGREWDKNKKTWKVVGPVVTKTMNSKHLWGKAFDATPFIGRNPYWPSKDIPENKKMYMALHNIANTVGLRTIGLWDAPHYELA